MLNADIIAGFSKSLLQQNYDQAVDSPSCHYEWWELCTSKWPKVAIAAPRRHAKSTAITLAYVLASVCFREKTYVLVVSDTTTQAVQFLGELKNELANNDRLRSLFQIQSFEKDTEDDVIVSFKDGAQFRIAAKGSEQKLRGLLWNKKRPNLVVCDDLENDEIVLNPERRNKFKRWFNGALIPSMAMGGTIRVVGTILHEDSLLNNLMPKEWDKQTIIEPLKMYNVSKKNAWKSFKYKAHTPDYKHLLWPSRYDAEWFMREHHDLTMQGLSDVYSQEYLNEPIDESVAYFKKGDFLSETTEDKKVRLNYYITGDLAIAKDNQADYSVFVVAGLDENRVLHVRNVIRDRLDAREIVDTIMSLNDVYDPVAIGLEDMQVSKSIGPFLREEMVKRGKYPPVHMLTHGGIDKIARAKSIQGRIRAHGIKFDKSADWYPAFEDELTKFPRGTKDDQVDAFAYLGRMLDSLIEAPTQKELDEEIYDEHYASSGHANDGRSAWTGY